jgi:hypothetical protein
LREAEITYPRASIADSLGIMRSLASRQGFADGSVDLRTANGHFLK